ncbi:Cue3 protein [Saccharomycopsis crataegensis]|uniref:Cue3 protein n=1 Tax=Saccharomycopsis crataegensis TaxID=43959 RepID=A0AAV5QSW8_9ASCO|nr:Cue3 protein [Saccharomycopsis crataegensis]
MPVDLSIRLKKKVVTFDGIDKLEIPIVMYPPLKLRSSLYDKDPVIWVHLLETYIQLFHLLLSFDNDETLSVHIEANTITQMKALIQKYLYESSLEQGQVLTLGSVNPQINEHNKTLRSLVFKLIEKYGLLYFGISGETLWHFIRVYIKGNSLAVRDLIIPNGKAVSLIPSLVSALEDLLANDKFHKDQIHYYGLMLGVMNQLNNQRGPKAAENKKLSHFDKRVQKFVNLFVNAKLIQILERYYGDGKSIHSNASKTLMVLTILSCSLEKLHKLAEGELFNKLRFKDKHNFFLKYPLFYGIIRSEFIVNYFNRQELESSLSFLFPNKYSADIQKKIDQIIEMFPQLSMYQGNYLLKQYENDANKVTNALLEDSSIISKIPEKKMKSSEKNTSTRGKSKYDEDDFAKLKFNSKNVILGKKEKLTSATLDEKYEDVREDLKKKTLIKALASLYESDEDEPDDSYLDAEIINSEQIQNNKSDNQAGKGKVKTKFNQKDFNKKMEEEQEKIENSTIAAPYNNAPRNNYNSFSRNNNTAPRNARNSSAQQNRDSNKDRKEDAKRENNDSKPKSGKTTEGERKKYNRNEKNKSKVANHNRKAGHDKKMAKAF